MFGYLKAASLLTGAILTVIGLAGLPQDLETWERWLDGVSQDTWRWIFVIVGILIAASPNTYKWVQAKYRRKHIWLRNAAFHIAELDRSLAPGDNQPLQGYYNAVFEELQNAVASKEISSRPQRFGIQTRVYLDAQSLREFLRPKDRLPDILKSDDRVNEAEAVADKYLTKRFGNPDWEARQEQ